MRATEVQSNSLKQTLDSGSAGGICQRHSMWPKNHEEDFTGSYDLQEGDNGQGSLALLLLQLTAIRLFTEC